MGMDSVLVAREDHVLGRTVRFVAELKAATPAAALVCTAVAPEDPVG